MRKFLLISLFLLMTTTGVASAMQLDQISWSQGNLQTLNAFDKGAVADFVRRYGGAKFDVTPEDVGDFRWVDLNGSGQYELVTVQDVSRKFFNALIIYHRGPHDEISSQWIDGWMIADLKGVIRDLHGDGKKELVVPTLFGEYGASQVSVVWPAVYALTDDMHYHEASRHFSDFYDREVLPVLEEKIKEAQGKTGEQAGYLTMRLTLERDKILRAIGRDPLAGLQEAYQWMNSDDPRLLQAAALTFKDIGGHEEQRRLATDAWKRAYCRRNPSVNLCRNNVR